MWFYFFFFLHFTFEWSKEIYRENAFIVQRNIDRKYSENRKRMTRRLIRMEMIPNHHQYYIISVCRYMYIVYTQHCRLLFLDAANSMFYLRQLESTMRCKNNILSFCSHYSLFFPIYNTKKFHCFVECTCAHTLTQRNSQFFPVGTWMIEKIIKYMWPKPCIWIHTHTHTHIHAIYNLDYFVCDVCVCVCIWKWVSCINWRSFI